MTTGLLTTVLGRNAIIAALGGGADLALTHVAWGDANGVPYAPNEAQTTLVNEKYRATIAAVAVVAGAIVVDAILPADTADASGRPSHGFNVAEVGLFSSAGTLIGLARCGNGYKPPPSSGQTSAPTYRLKLAVANPSAISVVIDPQAQIALGRHVRAPWLTVDGVLNAPPANPNQGATYIVGAAPTGAWAGFANRIAQWIGVWSLSVAPIGHHVVDNSKDIDSGARWLERTVDGWGPGVSRLVQKQPGNFVAVVGGTANALTAALDPAVLAHQPGLILRLYPSATNTGAVTLNEGAGALPLRYVTGADLFPGEIVPGRVVEVLCLGGVWVLLNPVEYFERLTPKRARQTSAFTPNVVLSDISGVDTANIVQTVTVTGATYIDVTAYLAIRNTVSTLVNVIAYTRLQRAGYPDQDSQYLGCQTANNIQIPMTIRTIYRNLDPTATYALRLIAQKGAAVGPVGVLDTYINATSD